MKKNILIAVLALLTGLSIVLARNKAIEAEKQWVRAKLCKEKADYNIVQAGLAEKKVQEAAMRRAVAERQAEAEKVAADQAYAEIENLKAQLVRCKN